MTVTPTIDAIVKMINWFRTKRVSISHHLPVRAVRWPAVPAGAGGGGASAPYGPAKICDNVITGCGRHLQVSPAVASPEAAAR